MAWRFHLCYRILILLASLLSMSLSMSSSEVNNNVAAAAAAAEGELLWESWDFDDFHTSDASIIPRGESSVTTPTLRLLKPNDELTPRVFKLVPMENFIIEASFPLVTTLSDPAPDIISQYLCQLPDEQAMLFLDSDNEHFDVFQSKYHNVAAL